MPSNAADGVDGVVPVEPFPHQAVERQSLALDRCAHKLHNGGGQSAAAIVNRSKSLAATFFSVEVDCKMHVTRMEHDGRSYYAFRGYRFSTVYFASRAEL